MVDSSMRGDAYPIVVFRSEAVEVGWQTAKRWGMVNDKGDTLIWKIEGVEISKIDPFNLSETAVDYKKWWLNHLEPAKVSDLYSPVYRTPSTWRIGGIWVTFESPNKPVDHETFWYRQIEEKSLPNQ